MTDANRESEIAEALAIVQGQRLRGEPSDLMSFRERLGASHAAFVDLVNLDAMIDDFTDPPAPERLPREFGSYTLVRELGQGAIGVVYEALHRALGRRAAVKVLKSGFDRDPEARARFRNEATATARVRHDHIVEIFDVGEIGGSPFYAMELVEGRPLSALIASRQLPPLADLCRQFAGIADALDKLHHAQPKPVIHRDVKPSNIMVRSDGRMILADFGLASATEGLGLTRTGVTLGSPLYMPPEQMLGLRAEMDARADVYALGATLYEAVALRPVFAPSTFEIVSKQVVSERPALLRSVIPACPAAIETIAKNALEKRREDRYQSAADMRDQLLMVADGRADAVPPPRVSPLRRLLRLVGSPAGLAAAASALLVIGAGLWWTNRPARIDITSAPDGAEVLLSGVSLGRTPLSAAIKPGTYEVVLHREGFQDAKRHVSLSAGEVYRPEYQMLALTDLDDPVSRIAIGRALNVDTLGYRFERDRGSRGDGPLLVLVYPRDNVRKADLDEYGFEVDFEALPATGGNLEFRRGEEVLSSEPFPENYRNGSNHAPFPKAVRDQLRVGDVVTWGLRFKDKHGAGNEKNVLSTFTVVSEDVGASLAAFQQRLAKFNLDESVRGELEVRKFWSLGLMTAALARADKLADAHVESGTLQALAKLAYHRLRIKDSLRVSVLTKRLDGLSKARQARLDATSDEPTEESAPEAPSAIPGSNR